MQLSKMQAELILKNLRERMNVKVRRTDGVDFCKSSIRLTSSELYAFDLAFYALKLSLAEEIMKNKISKIDESQVEILKQK